MKILHTESSCGWGGQELRVLNEAAGMRGRGHEVLIVTPEESRLYAEAQRRSMPVRALPIVRKSFAALAAMRAFLAAEAPDVVNCHSSTDSWLAALACIGSAVAPPLVRTRHISAPIPRNPASRWLYTRATAHVVTTGEALRAQVMRETGLAAQRVTSVPTGIDLNHFKPGDRKAARAALKLPSGRTIIGIVATLRSWKGHRYLVDAMRCDGLGEAHLLIVGDGPGRDNLHQQVDGNGLRDRVTFAGNQRDVVPWLQAMDIFALPSYANEGVPQALMQAMACGLPVVTTGVGAIPELVRHEQTGLMVRPEDSDALRQALLRIKSDDALAGWLATAGLAHVRAHCSLEAMLEGMEAVFRSVTATPLGRGAATRTAP